MNNEVILSNHVLIFFFVETVLLLILSIGFYNAIIILKKWDINSYNTTQYNLEKKSYLINTIIYFSLTIKMLLVAYFAFTIDHLSSIVPGAMCGAGVISSNIYGENLFITKIVLLFFGFSWLVLNYVDQKQKYYPYIKKRYTLYLFIYILIIYEFVLDLLYFTNISTLSIATCCSAIYSNQSVVPLPFGMNLTTLLVLFFTLYIAIVIVNYKKYTYISGILSIAFLYISYYAVLYFFGTYIYELPTHHCPFCMLQKDYYHVGYVIFISLFLGVFFSIGNMVLNLFTKKTVDSYFKYSCFFNTLFVLICVLYVVVYYMKNGVFL